MEEVSVFLLDPWLEDKHLCQNYPILYELSKHPNQSVVEVRGNDWMVEFREDPWSH
jgi:hypothetical protein